MVTKGLREMLIEATAATETIEPQEALELLGKEDAVFVDVRESHERAQGFIPGSIHAPRGFLEFIAHPEGPMHNPVFTSGKWIIKSQWVGDVPNWDRPIKAARLAYLLIGLSSPSSKNIPPIDLQNLQILHRAGNLREPWCD